MTKEEIIQYILQSPENTNPNVLKGMLDELDSNKGGDNMVVSLFESSDNDYYLSNYDTKEPVTYMDIVNYIKEGKIVQWIEWYNEDQYTPAAGASTHYFCQAAKKYGENIYEIEFLSYNYAYDQVSGAKFTTNSKDGFLTRVGD